MKEAETFLLWQGWNWPWCLAPGTKNGGPQPSLAQVSGCMFAGKEALIYNFLLLVISHHSIATLPWEQGLNCLSSPHPLSRHIHIQFCEWKKKKWLPAESVCIGQSYRSIFCFFNFFIIPVQAGQFVHVICTNSLQSCFPSMQMVFVASSKSVHSQIIGSSSLGSASSTPGRLLAPGFPFWSWSVT